ncbi:hypothetical protein A6R68_10822, partial [Neotoma lepida]
MTNSSSTSTSSTTGGSLLLLCEEEESWAGRRIPVSLLYSGLAIGGTLANGMVIYLVSSFRKLQTTSNAFIVNGCAADLSVCALWMPQEAVLGLLPAGSAEPPGDWDGGGGSYRLLRGGLLGLGLTVSLLSHCLVALNRYLLITRAPATYQVLYQRRHTAGMLALSWALALGLVLLLPPWAPKPGAEPPQVHYPALLAAGALLAQTALLLHCYLGIVRRVRVSVKRVSVLNFHLLHQLPGCAAAAAAFPAAPHAPGPGGAAHPAQPQPLPAALQPRRAQRRLSGLSVLLLCCVFLLATQPLVWVSLASGFSLPVPWGVQAASWLLCCALSALNPLLYTWRNEEFRRSVRSVLPGVGDAAAAAAAATAVPAMSQAQLGTRAAGQHWVSLVKPHTEIPGYFRRPDAEMKTTFHVGHKEGFGASISSPQQRLEMPEKMGTVFGASTVLWILFAACKSLTCFTEKPFTVDIFPGTRVAAQVGDSVVLTCAVVGCDSPSFSWRTQIDSPLNGEVRSEGAKSTLKLSPVSFENEHSYLCIVTCARRKLEKEIEVEVY